VASLSQGRTAAAQCGLFTHKSVPVIFEPPCMSAVKPKDVLVVGEQMYRRCECSLESEDTNFAQTIKVFSV